MPSSFRLGVASSSAGLPSTDHCRAELSTRAGPLVIEDPRWGVATS